MAWCGEEQLREATSRDPIAEIQRTHLTNRPGHDIDSEGERVVRLAWHALQRMK